MRASKKTQKKIEAIFVPEPAASFLPTNEDAAYVLSRCRHHHYLCLCSGPLRGRGGKRGFVGLSGGLCELANDGLRYKIDAVLGVEEVGELHNVCPLLCRLLHAYTNTLDPQSGCRENTRWTTLRTALTPFPRGGVYLRSLRRQEGHAK